MCGGAPLDARLDAFVECGPEVVDLGGEPEVFGEDLGRLLHVAVVDGDRDLVGAEGGCALAHHLHEPVGGLLDRHHDLGRSDILARESGDDPVQLVETDRGLTCGSASREGAPQLVLDVVEGGIAVAAGAHVGEDPGDHSRREGRARVVRPADHQARLAPERLRHDLDQAMARRHLTRRDPAAVGELGHEGMIAPDQHGRRLAGRGLDLVRPPHEGDGQPCGLEPHACGQFRHPLGPGARHHHHVDPVGDLAAAQEAVRGVQVGEVEVVLGSGAGTGPRCAAARCGRHGGQDDLTRFRRDGEGRESGEAQIRRVGSGGRVADALPGQELETVEGVGGEGGGRGRGARLAVLVVGQGGEEMDGRRGATRSGVVVGRAQRRLGEGDGGRGRRAVAGAEPGGQLVGDVGERGAGEGADVGQGAGDETGRAKQVGVVVAEDGEEAVAGRRW